MNKLEVLRKIYRLIKEAFGDDASVEIRVNSSGIEFIPTYTPSTKSDTL